MKVEQIYTGCLAQGAYYIESNGEAAIVDPLREVQPYIEMAESRKAKIKYIFETHFHADFVSGHVTLSEKTGAPVVYGPNAAPNFDAFFIILSRSSFSITVPVGLFGLAIAISFVFLFIALIMSVISKCRFLS